MQEKNCSLVVCGRRFAGAGAVVTDTYLRAYPAKSGVLNDWHGRAIGTWRIISTRPNTFFGRHSWVGDTFYYMRATVDGKEYSLRGFGEGMVACGRVVKRNGSSLR
jgi:hypothetical protein